MIRRRRMISSSMCDDYALNECSPGAIVMFTRIVSVADDLGRFHADPRLLKSYLLPLNDQWDKDSAALFLYELKDAGLVETYEVEGRPYLYLPGWEKNQTLKSDRNLRVEHPDPPGIQVDPNGIQPDPTGSNRIPSGSLSKEKRRKEKKREDGGAAPPDPPASSSRSSDPDTPTAFAELVAATLDEMLPAKNGKPRDGPARKSVIRRAKKIAKEYGSNPLPTAKQVRYSVSQGIVDYRNWCELNGKPVEPPSVKYLLEVDRWVSRMEGCPV